MLEGGSSARWSCYFEGKNLTSLFVNTCQSCLSFFFPFDFHFPCVFHLRAHLFLPDVSEFAYYMFEAVHFKVNAKITCTIITYDIQLWGARDVFMPSIDVLWWPAQNGTTCGSMSFITVVTRDFTNYGWLFSGWALETFTGEHRNNLTREVWARSLSWTISASVYSHQNDRSHFSESPVRTTLTEAVQKVIFEQFDAVLCLPRFWKGAKKTNIVVEKNGDIHTWRWRALGDVQLYNSTPK